MMPVGHVPVVAGCFVVPRIVMIRRRAMMLCGVLVVFRSFAVVFGALL